MHIRPARPDDFARILAIINDAARAYEGIIPQDQWHSPYMSDDALRREIADGVRFWVAEDAGRIAGVMGTQDRGDVALIRHAYVASDAQQRGVGTALLRHAVALASAPILVGTWADAAWAIAFYERNGFTLVPAKETDRLLRTYWSISERQIGTSVVLAYSGDAGGGAARHPR